MMFNCLCLYIAVLPIITVSAYVSGGNMTGVIIAFVYGYGGMFAAGSVKLSNLYPITASLGMIGYRDYDVTWNTTLCCGSMALMLVLTAVILLTMRSSTDNRQSAKKKAKAPLKKGW